MVASNLVAILKASLAGQLTETTWQLGARPAETNAPAADELEIKQRFGPNAQLLSSPRGAERDRKQYFEDLPGELQRVLRVQLRQPGDVSAVIEAPGGFLLYVAKETTDTALTVACLSLPKRSYEQWLSEQAGADEMRRRALHYRQLGGLQRGGRLPEGFDGSQAAIKCRGR